MRGRCEFVVALLLFPGAAAGQAPTPDIVAEPSLDGVEARFGTTVVMPSGLRGMIYNLRPNTDSLPKFEKLEPVGTIYTNGLNISPREFTDGFPGVTKRIEWFAI